MWWCLLASWWWCQRDWAAEHGLAASVVRGTKGFAAWASDRSIPSATVTGYGQVYCGLLCPFGAAQELLGRLGLRRHVSPGVDVRARYVKHVVLAVTVALFLLLGAKTVFEFARRVNLPALFPGRGYLPGRWR